MGLRFTPEGLRLSVYSKQSPMTLRRFYLPVEQRSLPEPFLEGDEARHLLKVLRLGLGDPVVLFDGTGWEGLARITRVEGKKVYFSIHKQHFLPHDSPLKISLALPLIRTQLLEWVLQKGTELGVSVFIPYYSAFSGAKATRQDWAENGSAGTGSSPGPVNSAVVTGCLYWKIRHHSTGFSLRGKPVCA